MADLPMPAPSVPPLSAAERLSAYGNMIFVDHGFFRAIYANRHRVSANVWRSAQPSPGHLRWAKAHGIQTVLNVRGRRETCGAYRLERDTCAELGLELIDFKIRSRSLQPAETLHAARALFDRLRYPVLMHCKSGSDRVGFMSALYLHLHEGVPVEEAVRELSLRYGHVRHAKTGVLDYFFECYERDTGGDAAKFGHWLDTAYDPVKLTKEFRASMVANFLVDRILGRE